MKDPFQLVPLKNEELAEFKREMQKAFQLGYEQEFGPCKEAVLPEEDIDRSLNSKGAFAYAARINGELAGGAIVVIDTNSGHNHLDLLFVKSGTQSKGVGQAIWEKIESLYPDTRAWETCTPYFEKRNIHFYVNRCGFHIVEFFNPHHHFPSQEEEYHGGMNEEAARYFFRFVKKMKSSRKESPSMNSGAENS